MMEKELGNLEKWDIEKIEGLIGKDTINTLITEKTAKWIPVASIME